MEQRSMSTEVTPPTDSETETTATDEIITLNSTENSTENEVTQVTEATKALVEALKRLAETKIQSVSSLPKEVSTNIEQTVKELQTNADKSWQSVVQHLGDIDERVMKALKAAWEILSAPASPEADDPDQDHP
jgi:sugar-specific transcriptional regulator TrmB